MIRPRHALSNLRSTGNGLPDHQAEILDAEVRHVNHELDIRELADTPRFELENPKPLSQMLRRRASG